MASDHTIKTFSAADIEKYHQGLLTPGERHALEKAALDDPFLADALEGFAITGIDHASDIADLQKRLAGKTSDNKVVPIGTGKSYGRWLRIAALFIFMAGSAAVIYRMAGKNKETGLAKTEDVKSKPVTESEAGNIVKSDTQIADIKTVKADNYGNTSTTNSPEKGSTTQVKTLVTAPATNTQTPVEIASGGAVRDTKTAGWTQPQKDAEAETREDLAKKIAADESKKEVAEDLKVIPDNPARKSQDKNLAVTTSPGNNNTYYKVSNQAENNNSRGFINANNSRALDNNMALNNYRGRVTDNNNVGLPFARVTNADDNNAGTYTDAQGNFNLTYPDSIVNLQIRSVGFENTNIQLRNTNAVNRVVLQEEKSQNEVVISNVKPNAEARAKGIKQTFEEPEPADGWDKYDTYLANNLEVPEEYRGKVSTAAQVEVSFEVDKYGNPVNIKVEKSLCKTCDKEAIRLIKEGPKWKQHTKKGRTKVTISFNTNL